VTAELAEVGRDLVVPLDERGDGSQPPHRLAVQIPHRRGDLAAVGVEQVAPLVGVAGEVDLPDAVGRDRRQVGVRIEPVVPGRDVDVVHVEQDPAVGQAGHLGQKLPLLHLGRPERGV
jgi:hypothetical protein